MSGLGTKAACTTTMRLSIYELPLSSAGLPSIHLCHVQFGLHAKEHTWWISPYKWGINTIEGYLTKIRKKISLLAFYLLKVIKNWKQTQGHEGPYLLPGQSIPVYIFEERVCFHLHMPTKAQKLVHLQILYLTQFIDILTYLCIRDSRQKTNSFFPLVSSITIDKCYRDFFWMVTIHIRCQLWCQ